MMRFWKQSALRVVHALPHVRPAVDPFGEQLVVRPAEHPNVPERRRSTSAVRVVVVKLEQAAFRATCAIFGNVRASLAVASEH